MSSKIRRTLPPAAPQGRPKGPSKPKVSDAKEPGIDLVSTQLERLAEFSAPPTVLALDPEETALEREVELFEEAYRLELAEAGREDFWTFLSEILYASPEARRHYLDGFHEPLARKLQKALDEPGSNILIQLFREARKTNLLIAFIAWLITRDPNIRVQIISLNQDRAKKIAAGIRRIFARGSVAYAKYQAIYPEMVIDGRKELSQAQQFTHPNRTAAYLDPTVFSTHLGGGTGGRCDVQIFDDAWDRQTLGIDPVNGTRVWNDFLIHLPLVEASSKGRYKLTFVICTPWTFFDPAAVIRGERGGVDLKQAQGEDRPWKMIIRHGKEHPTQRCTTCPPDAVDFFPHNEPSWTLGTCPLAPIITDDDLEAKRKLAMLKPEEGEQFFMLQYMVVYWNPDAAKFKEDWFRYHYPDVSWPVVAFRTIVLDDASKDFQVLGRGDYCCAIFGDWDDYGRLIARYGLHSNEWTEQAFLTQIVNYCELHKWYPDVVAKEKVSNDPFLSHLMKAFQDKALPIPHVIPLPRVGKGTKPDWIVSSLAAPLEAGRIVRGSQFPLELWEMFKFQTTRLGAALHDDIPDTFGLFFAKEVVYNGIGRRSHNQQSNWRPMDVPQPILGAGRNVQIPAPVARNPNEESFERGFRRVQGLGNDVMWIEEGDPNEPQSWFRPDI